MADKLKVLHVSDTLPCTHARWGGAEQAALRLISASIEDGISVSLITTRPDTGQPPAGASFHPSSVLDDYIGERLVTMLKLRHLGVDPISYRHALRVMKRERPDVVHLHRTAGLGLGAARAARQLGIPAVLSVYDYFNFCARETLVAPTRDRCRADDPAECAKCMGFGGAGALAARAMFGLRKRLFDSQLRDVRFHVLSEASAEALRSVGIPDARITKILQVFDQKSCKSTGTRKPGMILFVGWLQQRKGLHVLIEAMPEILRHAPDARLVAAGQIDDSPYSRRIRAMVEEKGLSGKVELLGKQPYERVSALITEASVVAVPEQWENMSPVVLVEAMCHSRPAVASRTGGIPEFIEDGVSGLMAAPASHEEFAGKISALLTDPARAEEMGRRASAHIAGLIDRKALMLKYRIMYRELTEATRGR